MKIGRFSTKALHTILELGCIALFPECVKRDSQVLTKVTVSSWMATWSKVFHFGSHEEERLIIFFYRGEEPTDHLLCLHKGCCGICCSPSLGAASASLLLKYMLLDSIAEKKCARLHPYVYSE